MNENSEILSRLCLTGLLESFQLTPLSEISGTVELEISAWVAASPPQKLPPNESITPTLKARSPSLGALRLGGPGLRPASQL